MLRELRNFWLFISNIEKEMTLNVVSKRKEMEREKSSSCWPTSTPITFSHKHLGAVPIGLLHRAEQNINTNVEKSENIIMGIIVQAAWSRKSGKYGEKTRQWINF